MSMSFFSSFIFPSNSYLYWIGKSALGLAGISIGPKPSYFFTLSLCSLLSFPEKSHITLYLFVLNHLFGSLKLLSFFFITFCFCHICFFLFAWRFLKVLASHQNSHVFSRHVVCYFLLLTRTWTCEKTRTARRVIWSGTFVWEEEEIAHLNDISTTRYIAFSKRFIN